MRFFLKESEYRDLIWVSACERAIHEKIEELSHKKLKLTPVGHGTESAERLNAPTHEKIEHLDYEVILHEKTIAIIELSRTRYTFATSKFFPINAYKVKRKNLPVYFVYALELEPHDFPERCWWITLEKAMSNLLQPEPVWLDTHRFGEIKKQKNYLTNKNAWTHGLQSLVNELTGAASGKSATLLRFCRLMRHLSSEGRAALYLSTNGRSAESPCLLSRFS